LPDSTRSDMCRLLVVRSQGAFRPASHLEKFASIARNSKEYQGHGWGCAWLDTSGSWRIYRHIRPVWEDDLSVFPTTTLLVAHARSAFEDKDIVVENNMPFFDGKRVFIFNGELRGVRIKEEGRIGAEKIFNFIRRFDRSDSLAALKKAVGIIRERTRHIRGMNIVMVKDRRIYLSTFFQEDPDYFTMHCSKNRIMNPQTSESLSVLMPRKADSDTDPDADAEFRICSEPFPGEQGWASIPNETVGVW
jgi:predicted glutamine amidotransferase